MAIVELAAMSNLNNFKRLTIVKKFNFGSAPPSLAFNSKISSLLIRICSSFLPSILTLFVDSKTETNTAENFRAGSK
ncbi:hypothetical protein WICPIJ_009055 [Wickerhamomyces pijperi]|uniref:Uncharacterized protein n=1 Tax=Wickerhamomyces pijperi TaxID=599730 RepID=A0A9P8PS90_WICPI|nr:hypothetical protein WICPIJ_009055 [Wickerhamomyces pijperi]